MSESTRLPVNARLRARRIPADAARLGAVRVRARHAQLGALAGVVRDLSVHGLALELDAEAGAAPLLHGDRLEEVSVELDGQLLYAGRALVRRVHEADGLVLVGVELEEAGVDLGTLQRHEARRGFGERFVGLERQLRLEEVRPEFKAFVADLSSWLAATREFLDAEERALSGEDRLTREETLRDYLDRVAPRIIERLEEARVELSSLVAGFKEAEHAAHRAYCRRHLHGFFAASPFMRRALEKPLGYAGDYEMMNMLYRDHAEGETLFGRALNLYGTSELAARANINRLAFLGERIAALVAATPDRRVRLASIGCGPARELSTLLQQRPELGRRLDVALVDQEERSIAFCERTLAPLVQQTGLHVEPIRESIRRLLVARSLTAALGARDLVYSAGLFDYLGDRGFGVLAQALYTAVVPGGRLLIGNVAHDNPSRFTMEYYSEWFLHHRTRDELAAFGRALAPTPAEVSIEAEPTGVNLFLSVRRAPEPG